MHSLEQRLRRLEKTVDPDDENAWMRHATDEELEARLAELDRKIQAIADANRMTVAELMTVYGFPEKHIERMTERSA